MNDADWRKAWRPYLERLIGTGRFPMLAKVVRDANHPTAEAAFNKGLDFVLDELAIQLAPVHGQAASAL